MAANNGTHTSPFVQSLVIRSEAQKKQQMIASGNVILVEVAANTKTHVFPCHAPYLLQAKGMCKERVFSIILNSEAREVWSLRRAQ